MGVALGQSVPRNGSQTQTATIGLPAMYPRDHILEALETSHASLLHKSFLKVIRDALYKIRNASGEHPPRSVRHPSYYQALQ
jgi:hypothetical protein